MVSQIYPTEIPLILKPPPPPLDLNLFITNGIVSSKINDKWDDFNSKLVNFPFLSGDVNRSLSYGVYISQHSFCESMFKCW